MCASVAVGEFAGEQVAQHVGDGQPAFEGRDLDDARRVPAQAPRDERVAGKADDAEGPASLLGALL